MLLNSGNTWVAINPAEFRQEHPECLTIRIISSHLDESQKISRVCLAAQVVKVFKTATDLKPGDLILITYSQDHERVEKENAAMEERAKTCWVGPQVLSFPLVLKSGDVRVAHLAKVTGQNISGSVYSPQAHQYSFEPENAEGRYQK